MESKSKVFQTQKVVQKKYSSSNESMLFLRKTDETIWNLPPPPPLSSNPPISEHFFHDPSLCLNVKNDNLPP